MLSRQKSRHARNTSPETCVAQRLSSLCSVADHMLFKRARLLAGVKRARAYLPALLSQSPESVDYFGAALLEFAMMNCGQTREEQCTGLG